MDGAVARRIRIQDDSRFHAESSAWLIVYSDPSTDSSASGTDEKLITWLDTIMISGENVELRFPVSKRVTR